MRLASNDLKLFLFVHLEDEITQKINQNIRRFRNHFDPDLISSLTPRFAKKVFMLFQEVSCIPISLSTPSRISRMMSGGALNDRISDKASLLMFPTAERASWIRGSTSESSISISFFLKQEFLL